MHSMKLLWKTETDYETNRGGDYARIIDDGDTIYVPRSGNRTNKKIAIRYIAVDKATGAINNNVPQRTETYNLQDHISFDAKEYRSGDMILRAKRFIDKDSHVIECLQNGKTLWEFRHKAYLYTDITERNGRVIFGTDGLGSMLYCLDIATGTPLYEIKTHFSGFYDYKSFSFYKENLIVYGRGTLVAVDFTTGRIVDEYKIPRKYPYRSFLTVLNGCAYCCVLTDDNRSTVLCFEL